MQRRRRWRDQRRAAALGPCSDRARGRDRRLLARVRTPLHPPHRRGHLRVHGMHMSIRIGAFWNAQDESGRGPRARNEGSRTCTDQSGAKSTRFLDVVSRLAFLSPPNLYRRRAHGEGVKFTVMQYIWCAHARE